MIPKVSVVMAVMNRPAMIRDAASSVLRQSVRELELIIVQDGFSEDVTSVATTLCKEDDRVKHLRRGKIGTIGDATNAGVHAARGDLIAILDDDDEWIDEKKLEKQVTFLSDHVRCVACGGGVVVTDIYGSELMRYRKPQNDREIRRVALLANPIANSSALYRKSAWRAVGGYSCDICDFQDWDFWLRLGCVGELANLSDYIIRYTVWPKSSSATRLRSNAESAIRIVRGHRMHYPNGSRALVMAYSYFAVALLPRTINWHMYRAASLLKKWAFSRRW